MAKLQAEEKRLDAIWSHDSLALRRFPRRYRPAVRQAQGQARLAVSGRLAGDYGQPRDGGPVKWNGVLLEATEGTPVRAIYRGRVAFADWLPGLGLLIIVDHGGGYMSLYGHNEALLKESGDWVEPGDDDRARSATPAVSRGRRLYFEIRKNGEPLNPHQWIKQDAGGAETAAVTCGPRRPIPSGEDRCAKVRALGEHE